MQFRTEIPALGGCRGMISHGHPLLLVGSCFSDNIGRELTNDLFDTTVNPFGPLYNPLSILRAFGMLEPGAVPERFCTTDGRFVSFDAHSRISAAGEGELRQKFADCLSRTRSCLREDATVLITLGTTRVFSLKSDGLPVANCHKQSGRLFDERNLDLDETVDILERTVGIIRRFHPGIRIVLTVSPLRYNGTDPHSNTVAKSVLHLATDRIAGSHEGVVYFPAYEIMMDDLRDYRFYADDMRHPSDKAVAYIYEKFSQSFFDDPTMALSAEARRLTRRLSHISDKPRDPSVWPEYAVIQSHPELNGAYQRYLIYGVENK